MFYVKRKITNVSLLNSCGEVNSTRNPIPVNIEGIEVRIPSLDDLILNKRASGRTKDLADAEALESEKK